MQENTKRVKIQLKESYGAAPMFKGTGAGVHLDVVDWEFHTYGFLELKLMTPDNKPYSQFINNDTIRIFEAYAPSGATTEENRP